MSLAESTISVMLPITEKERAKRFYSELLELPLDGSDEEGDLMFRLGGGAELVLRSLPSGEQSEHTALSFEVADLRAEIDRLEARGVSFEDYDEPGFTTVDHVFESGGERAAWFLDPDGNILCLHEAGSA
jgi:catechol 2,3-dioxygenase-like lactoylglutathione lyase family enzyme